MTLKAPFPYFGGKARAASFIWARLGDPGGYIEPFAGSAAILLARPPMRGRRAETLNDADGWLVNTWRAIRDQPAEVARHASGPVTEIDYHARLAWLQERRTDDLVSWLEGDPEKSDAKAAGWWLYVASLGIGDPWGPGPWHTQDGRLVKMDDTNGIRRTIPHLSSTPAGVIRQMPAISSTRGVQRDNEGLEQYMERLARRLTYVRITSGDWKRVLQPSVLNAALGNKSSAVVLDPPYATSGDLYATTNRGDDHLTMSAEVRAWCVANAHGRRVVLCGFDGEHDELLRHGWTVEAGKAGSSGYTVDVKANRRERLWFSPACLDPGSLLDFGLLGPEYEELEA